MLLYSASLIVGLLLSLFGLFGVIGSFIPVTHTAQVSVEVGSPLPRVWEVLDKVEDFPSWCPGVDRVEMLPDHAGHRTFRQHQGRNSFVLEETVKQPPTQVVRTITDDNKMFSGQWDHQMKDLGNGRTLITVRETGSVAGAIPRAVMKLFFGYDYYLNKFAQAVRAKCGA
jgi:uncharacterized membrane protein